MAKVLDVQCPSCGAPIHFNSALGKMKCDYCNNVFDPASFKSEYDDIQDVSYDNYVTYNCPDCGAEIVTDENTSATFCLYCGNTAIIKNKLSGEFKPDKIIPFKIEKEEAIKAFKKVTIGKPLAPKLFNLESNIERITGLYVPYWLYEINVHGSVSAEGTNVSSWTSGDYKHIKTDYYDLERQGSMIFKSVPVDGSMKLDNAFMNSLEPFYFHYLVSYNHAYLSGYYAEKYDVSKEIAFEDAKERTLKTTRNTMIEDMGNYTTKSIRYNTLSPDIVKIEYALLPIWMVNVKFKDKYYMFAMNGQTGEFIGDVPLDKKRVIIFSIIIFTLVFALIIGISILIYVDGGNPL